MLLSLLRNKDEMLSSFMSANAMFLDYQELSIVVWYSNSGSSVTNRKTSAGAGVNFFRFGNLRSQRVLISHIITCCYVWVGFTSKL